MLFDPAASNNVVKTGDLVTLTYSNTVNQVQQFASTTENLLAGNFFGFAGSIILSPAGETSPDFGTNPDVVNNLELYSNFVNLNRAWNTQWGAWTEANQTVGGDIVRTQLFNEETTASIDRQSQEISRQLATQPSNSSIYVGEFVSNVSLNPFIKSRFVYFRAAGLKPFARVFPFFAQSDVSNICMPLRPYDGTITSLNGSYVSTNNLPVARDFIGNTYEYGMNGATYASPLIADSSGNVFGVMLIPPNTFRAGELEFRLVDTPVLTLTGATTQATAIFFGSSLSLQRQRVDLQIRPVVNITQEITTINNITQEITVSAPAGFAANPYYWQDGDPSPSGGVGEDSGTSDSASSSSSSDSASSSSSDGSGESSGDSW